MLPYFFDHLSPQAQKFKINFDIFFLVCYEQWSKMNGLMSEIFDCFLLFIYKRGSAIPNLLHFYSGQEFHGVVDHFIDVPFKNENNFSESSLC